MEQALRLLDEAERVALAGDGDSQPGHRVEEIERAFSLVLVATVMASIDLDRAEQIASGIADITQRGVALRSVARVAVASDPNRARQLVAKGEQVALHQKDYLVLMLIGLAEVAADFDHTYADRLLQAAEKAARTCGEGRDQSVGLSRVARAIAETDPQRAADLADDAEQIARTIPDQNAKDTALGWLASKAASFDLDRAQRIAGGLPAGRAWDSAWSSIARALIVTDPAQAEQAARHLGGRFLRLSTLAAVIRADFARAEHIAAATSDDIDRAVVMAAIGQVLTDADPVGARHWLEQADQLAQTIPDGRERDTALCEVGVAWAGIDRVRAEQIARAATRREFPAALTVWNAITRANPTHAEQIVQSLTQEMRPNSLLARVTKADAWLLLAAVYALTDSDPARAEDIASAITHSYTKVRALTKIASAHLGLQPSILRYPAGGPSALWPPAP